MNDSEIEVLESHAKSFSSLMGELEGHVQDLLKTHAKIPKDIWEAVEAFSYAINWQENFIRILIACHIVLLVTVVLTRKSVEIQFSVFCTICLCVFFAERINSWCYDHWRDFATQNYFDKQGLFASIFLCAPLLLIAFLQLVLP
jgi:diacylglycerol kinase